MSSLSMFTHLVTSLSSLAFTSTYILLFFAKTGSLPFITEMGIYTLIKSVFSYI